MVTMCENPFGSPSQISAISLPCIDASASYRERSEIPRRTAKWFARSSDHSPRAPSTGRRVFVATTAPEQAGPAIKRHLESEHGCEVVGMSHSLSDREKLEGELEGIKDKAEMMLCEIKAAAVDVATRQALDEGLDVVYMDNVPDGCRWRRSQKQSSIWAADSHASVSRTRELMVNDDEARPCVRGSANTSLPFSKGL